MRACESVGRLGRDVAQTGRKRAQNLQHERPDEDYHVIDKFPAAADGKIVAPGLGQQEDTGC